MIKHFYLIICSLVFYLDPLFSNTIKGTDFNAWIESQNPQIQKELEVIFKEENGFTVTGPLSPLMNHNSNTDEAYHALRVICHHSDNLCEAITIIENIPHLSLRQYFLQPEYEGVLAVHHCCGKQTPVLFCTLQQTRYMIWYKDQVDNPDIDTNSQEFHSYAQAILEYFDNLEDQMPFDPPKSIDYDLPPSCEVFPEKKSTSISHSDYQKLLTSHQNINWGTIRGVKGFIPSEELKDYMISNAPHCAFQDMNSHLFQKHLQKLYDSQGRDLIGKPLTADSLDTTAPGTYLFAVAISGKARFARLAGDPEHNSHSVLLLGEPALCAGIMEIGCDGTSFVSSANIFSPQYFFSPYADDIHEIITKKSDNYIATMGHFLQILKNEYIPHESIIIKKYYIDDIEY